MNSHFFPPSIGGIESCSYDLACEFVRMGHHVKVITKTLDPENLCKNFPFDVQRRPSIISQIQNFLWADVYYQNNISLQALLPNLLIRKPCFVTTATWLNQDKNSESPLSKLKRFFLRFANNIYISKAIKDHVGHPGEIIPNPYRKEIFINYHHNRLKNSLIFVGRLVSDKGCDLLITAFHLLKKELSETSLTIIGDGPERKRLETLCKELGLQGQVTFRGILKDHDLAEELNYHEIMVVPSRWEEPFGIVALEGMACGCVVVGSSGGGLGDAIGPGGQLFESGNPESLYNLLKNLFKNPDAVDHYRKVSISHVGNHGSRHVAERYITSFKSALR